MGEKDQFYKIKKHHQNNLNQHYKNFSKQELEKLQLETEKELYYLKSCRIVEDKIKSKKFELITLKETNTLIKRNYTLFNNDQKKDLSKINHLYYSLTFANILGVSILTSFCKSLFLFFNYFKTRHILRNFILTTYFFMTVGNNTLYVNDHIKKKKIYYLIKIIDLILDKSKEKLKVPYNENMYTYKPEEKNEVFNYI